MAEAKPKKPKSKGLALSSKPVEITDPAALEDFSKTLKMFIVQQGLFTKIQNKNYVNVEGWQFAGGVMGVFARVSSLKRIKATNEIKYRAEVELYQPKTDLIVGYGVAVCSNKEDGKGKKDEYVIASMAQTRAIGKAYRNSFAWLMKMAGYESTPAEEATGASVGNLEPEVAEAIRGAKTANELNDIYANLNAKEKQNAAQLIADKIRELKANKEAKKAKANATA